MLYTGSVSPAFGRSEFLYVALIGLKFTVLLPRLLECYHCRHGPLCLVLDILSIYYKRYRFKIKDTGNTYHMIWIENEMPPSAHTFEHLVPSCTPFWEVVKPCGIVLAGRRKTLDVGLWSLASNGASFSVSLPATVASRSCWWKWRHALSSRMDWCSWKQMPKQALPLLSCFCRYFVLVIG